jgi:hypothetical protein
LVWTFSLLHTDWLLRVVLVCSSILTPMIDFRIYLYLTLFRSFFWNLHKPFFNKRDCQQMQLSIRLLSFFLWIENKNIRLCRLKYRVGQRKVQMFFHWFSTEQTKIWYTCVQGTNLKVIIFYVYWCIKLVLCIVIIKCVIFARSF